MLYWGEGKKGRNVASIANSDPNIIKIFARFLKKFFDVPNDKITWRCNCFLDCGLSLDEVEQYWLEQGGLSKNGLLKSTVDHRSRTSTGKQRHKSRYGVCSLQVNDVRIVQAIYGGIQEYAGLGNLSIPKWPQ
jgi:hypothetical protein